MGTIQIKRRESGASGAPATMKSGELAWNNVDDSLYIGAGDDGEGNSLTQEVIGGIGAFLALTGDQTINGQKDFITSPEVPTLASTDNTNKAASTAFVKAVINELIASSPNTLDTLNEIAQALGNDENFAATMTNALAAKAPLASPVLTGNPTAPNQALGNNTQRIANTSFVQDAIDAIVFPTPDPIPTPLTQVFTTYGATITLNNAPVDVEHVSVYFDGLFQDPALYTLNGSTITFTSGSPTGVGKILVHYWRV